ncbi:hypothetical protein [Methanobrevibacter sp. V74]|uniref:hypothetical protein n=1 Tax=Methanobrevibacter sp. V74 TaxID=3064279 RepID=UPI002734B95B|nr:hypothetical protein [Methanobrevibacter sp. V74]
MIKNLNKVIIVFLFLIFLSISVVSAQDNATSEIDLSENTTILEVEDNDRLNVEMNKSDLKGSTSTFTDLQNIINGASSGSTITLNKDYTYVFGDNAIIINKPLTIDGKNHVLNGKLATRIFWIGGDQVTLKNIRFINANNTQTDWGGAIDWLGDNANLENCYFENNHARKLGGAIYLHGTQGNIKNCTFNNNHAEYGGAVYWNGNNGELKDCSFVNNHAEYGGAVCWTGDNGFLSACSFVNNHAKWYGGAVCWTGANGKVVDCSFVNNHADEDDGAVYWNGDNGKVVDCSFVNNHADGYGGAVYWRGDNGFLSACSFVNNHAKMYGGAVCWTGDNGKVVDCSFVNNHAKKFKGNVIYWFKSGDIFACTFSVFRPKNTNTVTVNNLIYYENNNYNVDYYENGNKILNSGINKNIAFSNLNSGKHTIKMIYKKDGNDLTNDLIITGDSYLNSNNVYMFYNDGTKYKVKLTDYQGKPLIYKNLQITIKNKKYNLKTDKYGYATILLKQKPGQYSIIAKFNGDKDYGPSTFKSMVKILKFPITKNKNMNIYFMGGIFKVQIIHANGKNVGAGKTVKFTISGKTYSKKTDKNGYASLKITQKPKTHTITTKYGKFITKNKITIQPVLTAKNIIKKKTKTTKFQAKLVNTKGKPQAKKKITFKFKGKKYKKLTNKKGIATLKIKNLKKGKYNIYTQYTKSKIKNTITIK